MYFKINKKTERLSRTFLCKKCNLFMNQAIKNYMYYVQFTIKVLLDRDEVEQNIYSTTGDDLWPISNSDVKTKRISKNFSSP